MAFRGWRCRVGVGLVVAIAGLGSSVGDALAGVRDVIPLPREIKPLDGTMTLDGDKPLRLVLVEGSAVSYALGVRQLVADLKKLGVTVEPGAIGGEGPTLTVGRPSVESKFDGFWRKAQAVPDPKWGREGYRLRITPSQIVVAGNGEAGCFYGLQTVRQMLEPVEGGKGARLECVDVGDWPAMKWRGTMFPLQSPAEHARLASYKMNLLNWEVNQQPDYKTIPEFAGGTPLSHYREVAASARRHFVSMTLETQSFGHVRWMLEKFPKLRALPDDTHVLRPLHAPTYELIGRIYAELCPLYDTPIYHPGCDEAWGIEEWAKGEGLDVDEVIGKHLQHLADLLAKHGKRTMVWGDYLLKHRGAVRWMKPKDFIVCDWHYEPVKRYPSVEFFVSKGFETLVSPAVVPARPIFPDYDRQIPNIRNFIQDGVKRGAVGLLNTNWPVGPMPTECYWYGWICGAEYAWNPTGRTQQEFDEVFFKKVYNVPADEGHRMFRLLAKLDAFHQAEQRAGRPPEELLKEYVQEGMQIAVPEECVQSGISQEEMQALMLSLSPTPTQGGPRLAAFQSILRRLMPLPKYLGKCRKLADSIAEAISAQREGRAADAAEALFGVRQWAEEWVEFIQASPGLVPGKDALTLARGVIRAVPSPGRDADRQIHALKQLLKVEPKPMAKTLRLKPGTFFQVESGPKAVQPPHGRPEGWCHFRVRGAGASWRFRFRKTGRYRILALLRHSAGLWENDRFVKGGRNAVYVGRYGWQLDGQPIKERWIGEELNPDADEAFQWAVLVEKDFKKGTTHSLSTHVAGINHAIVAEFVITEDADFKPETKRSDIRMK